MNIYAVIDTNVIVSSMMTNNPLSPTRQILENVQEDKVTPMINDDILEEYKEVLSRTKFHFAQDDIDAILNLYNMKGVKYIPECLRKDFIDLNDVIFYETYLLQRDAYLITGNLRHFPKEPRIVSPADMVHIISITENTHDNILSASNCLYMSDTKRAILQRAWEAAERMRASALANGIADMSMEEVDEEIRQYREEKRRDKLV